jgi:hypothetical protein
MDGNINSSEPSHPPRWAEGVLRLFLRHDQTETAFGDLLEAYRDSILPQRGAWRADLWFIVQVAGYILRANTISPRHCLFGAGVLVFWLLALLFGGGVTLLATLLGSAVTLLAVPLLFILSNRRMAAKLFAVWAAYLVFYAVVSTGMALYPYYFKTPPRFGIGQEICADSGCFAVDRVEKAHAGPGTAFTVFWHLASNDRQLPKHFPGKGLEIYMFDERGRTFGLSANANQNPLDVMLPPGQTVRDAMTFNVPSDVHEVFLTAKYRPYTFQSLLPGELSLVRLAHAPLVQIQ